MVGVLIFGPQSRGIRNTNEYKYFDLLFLLILYPLSNSVKIMRNAKIIYLES